MLENAIQKPNITYKVSPAESLPVDDASVDMVVAATAFHWFEHDAFLREAKRVLKPKGTLAVFGYHYAILQGHPEAASIYAKMQYETIHKHMDNRIRFVMNYYRDIQFPFTTQEWYISPSTEDTTNISVTKESLMPYEVSLEDLKSFTKTTSGYVALRKEHQNNPDFVDPVDIAFEEIKNAMNTQDMTTKVKLEFPFAMILATND